MRERTVPIIFAFIDAHASILFRFIDLPLQHIEAVEIHANGFHEVNVFWVAHWVGVNCSPPTLAAVSSGLHGLQRRFRVKLFHHLVDVFKGS